MTESESLLDLYGDFIVGNEAAGKRLVAALHARLLPRARKRIGARLKDRVHSEEVAQSALGSFLKAARRDQYTFKHSWALWRLILTILENKIRRASRRVHETLPSAPERPAPGPSPDESVILADLIEKILEGLPPRCGEVLQLRLEDYTITDITALLGVSRWTVRRDLKRLERRLESVPGINGNRSRRELMPV